MTLRSRFALITAMALALTARSFAVEAPVTESANPMAKAEDLIQQGKAAEALPLIQDEISRSPDSAEAWRGMGRAMEAMGQWEMSLAAYEKALALDPNDEFSKSKKQEVLTLSLASIKKIPVTDAKSAQHPHLDMAFGLASTLGNRVLVGTSQRGNPFLPGPALHLRGRYPMGHHFAPIAQFSLQLFPGNRITASYDNGVDFWDEYKDFGTKVVLNLEAGSIYQVGLTRSSRPYFGFTAGLSYVHDGAYSGGSVGNPSGDFKEESPASSSNGLTWSIFAGAASGPRGRRQFLVEASIHGLTESREIRKGSTAIELAFGFTL